MNSFKAKSINTRDWYANTPKVWRGNHWVRKVDFIYSCKWCGEKMPLEKGSKQRKYCPRPKSCRELAYQRRKNEKHS